MKVQMLKGSSLVKVKVVSLVMGMVMLLVPLLKVQMWKAPLSVMLKVELLVMGMVMSLLAMLWELGKAAISNPIHNIPLIQFFVYHVQLLNDHLELASLVFPRDKQDLAHDSCMYLQK